jgi:hypothetical protein
MKIERLFYSGCLIAVLLCTGQLAKAQDNYEIQVYGSETVPKGNTLVELHNNFRIEGFKTSTDGLQPTNHQWHETLEITHGFTEWFEVGFYVFTSLKNGYGWDYVGDHIRPRVRVPEKWALARGSEHLPGAWVSAEAIFRRYLDVRIASNCGQDTGAMVSVI